MPSVVFDVEFEPETIAAIDDLRKVRRDVLKTQISEMRETLDSLVSMGALKEFERVAYEEKIKADLSDKLDALEERLKFPETLYADELELYLELLANP